MSHTENPPDQFHSAALVPRWSDRYTDPAVLRREADAMSSAYVTALREAIPDEQIEGIYLKGSATKPWESPLDYVPELSDVDIHLLLRDGAPEAYMANLEQTMAIQSGAEKLFLRQVPEPVHFPRPQLMLANNLFTQPNFVPSPPSVVKVVYGKPYPSLSISEARVRAFDLENLLMHEQYLADLPLSSIDNPGPHLRVSLRTISWRVSPTGSRVLHSLGPGYEQVWGTNRSGIVRLLLRFGQKDLATAFVSFYLRAWDYFLSGYKDSDAGRAALLAGARVLRLGIEFAKAHGGAAPSE